MKKLHDTLTKQIEKQKQQIRSRILDILQAVVPGYDSCRPAMAIIREEKFYLTDTIGKKKHLVMAVANFLGDFQVILAPTKDKGYGFANSFDHLTIEEMMQILQILDQDKYIEDKHAGKYLRAINPWWFVNSDKKINELTANLLGQSQEDYLKIINNNPKNKK